MVQDETIRGNKVSLDTRLLKKNFVDVCAGGMTPDEAGNELTHYMKAYAPDKMVVTIRPATPPLKPYVAIYITKAAFTTGYIGL